jgi:hypothetical protein
VESDAIVAEERHRRDGRIHGACCVGYRANVRAACGSSAKNNTIKDGLNIPGSS